MIIRLATIEDNEALCALEARTPLAVGERAYYFKPKDFFENHELQDRWKVVVAEERGQLIGACAGSVNQATLGGAERFLLYLHHQRIVPESQGRGLGRVLARAVQDQWARESVSKIDSSYWFIAEGNRSSRDFVEKLGHRPWRCSTHKLIFRNTGAAFGQPLPIDRSARCDVVRLINRTHLGKELFQPYDQARFDQRLSQAGSYNWSDLYGRLDGGRLIAIAGLWRNIVADLGYAAGAEQQMALLLQDLIAPTWERWQVNLTIFESSKSEFYRQIEPLCQHAWEFLLYAKSIPPPAEPVALYIDPAYF